MYEVILVDAKNERQTGIIYSESVSPARQPSQSSLDQLAVLFHQLGSIPVLPLHHGQLGFQVDHLRLLRPYGPMSSCVTHRESSLCTERERLMASCPHLRLRGGWASSKGGTVSGGDGLGFILAVGLDTDDLMRFGVAEHYSVV